jgi:Flp pilus assembly protein TadD
MEAMSTDPASQITADLKLAAQSISSGQPAKAALICRQVLARFPNNPQALYALGVSQAQLGQMEDAIAAYEEAIRQKPDFFEAHSNLGTILGIRGRTTEAIAAFARAAKLRPDVAEIQVNLSNAQREMWRLEEAVVSARRAIALKPALGEAHLCLGAALACQGCYREAIETYRQAIRIRSDFPAAHLNLALAELVTGNLQSAWPEYEWRKKCTGVLQPRTFAQPRWSGEPLEGKTILLYAEQGHGDAIHFVRYAPTVAGRGGKVIVEVPPSLTRLFERAPGIDQVVPTGQPPPQFDFQLALPSLPGAFNTTLESIPAPVPYLFADSAEMEAWRERLSPAEGVLQVGLVWAGNPENRNDRNRSISLEKFAPIAQTPRMRFHSLQVKPFARTAFALEDWSGLLNDFAQTAGLMANLDLVISVDTAPAHLAAAMGKPVWLLIPFPPDWRWLLDRDDSPWYPTMRLFRQPTPGDWATPIESVASALREYKISSPRNT